MNDFSFPRVRILYQFIHRKSRQNHDVHFFACVFKDIRISSIFEIQDTFTRYPRNFRHYQMILCLMMESYTVNVHCLANRLIIGLEIVSSMRESDIHLMNLINTCSKI